MHGGRRLPQALTPGPSPRNGSPTGVLREGESDLTRTTSVPCLVREPGLPLEPGLTQASCGTMPVRRKVVSKRRGTTARLAAIFKTRPLYQRGLKSPAQFMEALRAGEKVVSKRRGTTARFAAIIKTRPSYDPLQRVESCGYCVLLGKSPGHGLAIKHHIAPIFDLFGSRRLMSAAWRSAA